MKCLIDRMIGRMIGRVIIAVALAPSAASADVAPKCQVVDVSLEPASDDLQIVAWIEDPAGTYEDTIFITQQTGRFGLGNRPGRFDLNSGPPPPLHDVWPYGRRSTVAPVWAHRHGIAFPELVFQDGDDNNISHLVKQSSPEHHYCRPFGIGEAGWDTGTCASAVWTDKGTFSPTATTGYPPRADLVHQDGDSPSVDMFKAMDPFDAVSGATPIAGVLARLHARLRQPFPQGNHVLWIEVSRGFDYNATYNQTTYPAPMGLPYGAYGQPYRGQPSVIYKVPFTVGDVDSTAATLDYVGYGDPDGNDGNVRPPDATITSDKPASGASRLQPVSEGSLMYRVKIDSRTIHDSVAPANPAGMTSADVTTTTATVTFITPGNDGMIGKAARYEIRYLANTEMTADNFASASPITSSVVPGDPGTLQSVTLAGLLPETDYWVGVRAFDDCDNSSDIAIVKLTTADRQAGEVNACFVATAAYGSLMANDVEKLRHFRDAMLRTTTLGELAIETYYTFGPPVAGVIGESELLRSTARDVLAPIVAFTRSWVF